LTAQGWGRPALLLATFLAAVLAVFSVGPVAQDTAYHDFADARPWAGIANFGDVMSNLPFAVVGIVALVILWRKRSQLFANASDFLPYAIFFVGVAFVSLGSGYYHAEPSTERLFWDRLPMTVAFMALFAAFIADRMDRWLGIHVALPVLLLAGALSVVYWQWSEAEGHGDLRPYGLVQFYPMLAIPLICWLYPKGRYTDGRYVVMVLGWYGLAKLLEHFDGHVFDLLGHAVSGHTLKHLAAAVGPWVVLRMVLRAASDRETDGQQSVIS
jgi:Ceramidase